MGGPEQFEFFQSESLESRMLLASTFAGVSPDGVLRVRGTDLDDVIVVREFRNQYFVATVNGQSKRFGIARVNSFVAYCYDGNDSAVSESLLANTLYGGNGNDTLNGSLTVGGSGNDTLTFETFVSGPGTDLLNASTIDLSNSTEAVEFDGTENNGAQFATLTIGDDRDFVGMVETIVGTAFDDVFHGGNRIDHPISFYGNDGNDLFTPQTALNFGATFANGGAGNDTFYSGLSSVAEVVSDQMIVNAGMGNDLLIATEGFPSENFINSADMGDGLDTMDLSHLSRRSFQVGGESQTDENFEHVIGIGAKGKMTVNAARNSGRGIKYIAAGANAVTINAGTGNDTLIGSSRGDRLSGSSGNDQIEGNAGNDRLDGGRGNDKLSGNEGDDRLNGNSGNDTLNGGAGRDFLAGQDGNDLLIALDGEVDTVNGGSGIDRASRDNSAVQDILESIEAFV